MRLIQFTPGAGRMYCGNCFRDNALVAELRRMGHDTLMVPLYLPLTLDEPDQSAGTPVFYGGVNVYLDQQWPWFRRHAPERLRQLLTSPRLLRWAAGRAAKTRATEVGELTLSMLRGEEGHQARELDELIQWLRTQPKPDAVCLSNVMLIGLARRLRRDLGARVVCMLQGEDAFLDGLPASVRDRAWETIRQRTPDVDRFLAPSRYFADLMSRRLGLSAQQVRVVHNGISLEGYEPAAAPPTTAARPTIGYFARMCADKGLDLLVDAFIQLRQRARVPHARLRIGGGCGPSDEPYVRSLEERLAEANLSRDVDWVRNPERSAKLEFLRSLSVFSVPARYGEAFGLYLIEAWAAGVPVVQPRTAAFPELIDQTGGGRMFDPENAADLSARLEELLLDPAKARELGRSAQTLVQREFTARRMAENLLRILEELDVHTPPTPALQTA
jgi:glycosyltransferase involved in cell wall biosynthesis